jgi:phosphatidylglycerol---prolipoprotein diacylglyceryl transferase
MYPILLDLGFWQLRAYGVFVALAILAGVWWSARGAEQRGFSRSAVYDLAWTVVIAALVGARLYYVAVSEPAAYAARPWMVLAVWHGGLSIHGALLAGFLALVWEVRRRGLPLWRFADVVFPGLALGQAFGQLACLLNGDSYGTPTAVSWAITYTDPAAMAPLGVPLHPLQVYELLAYAAIFLVLVRLARSTTRDGAVLLAYLGLYGAARFGLEFFRGDAPMAAGVAVAQVVSMVLVLAAVVGAWLSRRAAATPA